MCVQSTVIVLERSHFDPCVLPRAHLKFVELVRVWHLYDYCRDGLFKTGADDFKTFLNCKIMIVYPQLLL